MMQKNPKHIEETLRDYFRSRSDVAAAYLFGSYAQDAVLPTSDVDIAILYKPDQIPLDQLDAKISLGSTLAALLNHPDVDVHVLTTAASLPFIHEVLRCGRRLVTNDEESTARFEAAMQVRYLDYQPIQQEYLKAMEERLQQGTYGNR